MSESSNPHAASDAFVDTITAAMPPSHPSARTTSVDQLLAEMNRIPLFMTSLDDTDGAGGENVMLEAIKALAYEGTRAEVAANFREQGNECARAKQWTDAREFYTKAILALRGEVKVEESEVVEGQVERKVVDAEEERKKERTEEESSLMNRALCNLELKNYGMCNRDCAAVLSMNPRNVKAWYRAASACLALDKLAEAIDACECGLKVDPQNFALRAMLMIVRKRETYLADVAKARERREQEDRNQRATLNQALKSRNIVRKLTDTPVDMEDAVLKLEDVNNHTSTLIFPVLLLYPLHAQTDLIKAFRENEKLLEHLDYILPTPWDEKAEYTPATVECYMETIEGGLIKAGKKLPLLKLLGSGKVQVLDDLVRVYVVPTTRAQEWIEQFKLRRGRQ